MILRLVATLRTRKARLAISEVRGATGRGALLLILETWLSRASGAVIFFLLARALTPADFGIVALALSVTAVAALLMDQGLHQAVVRQAQPTDGFLSTAFWTSLAVGTVVALLVVVSAPLSAALLDDHRLTPLILALAPLFVLNSLETVPSAILVRDLRFGPLVRRRVLATLVSGVSAAVLAYLTGSYWALAAQNLISGTVSCVLVLLGTRWRPSWTFSRVECTRIWRFGRPLFGINLLYLLQTQDRLLIGAALGPVALGYYTLGTRVLALATELVSGALSSVALPAFARLHEQVADAKGDERVVAAYLRGTALILAVGCPLMLLLSIGSREVVSVFFGVRWLSSAPVLSLLALGAISTFAVTFDHALLVSRGTTKLELRIHLFTSAVLVPVYFVGLRFGTTELAAGLALAGFATWAVRVIALVRAVSLFSIQTYVSCVGPILTAGLVAGSVGGLTHNLTRSQTDAVCLALVALAMAISQLLALLVLSPDTLRDAVRTVRSAIRRGKEPVRGT